MQVNWNITDDNVVVNFNGETHIKSRKDDKELCDALIAALKAGENDKIPQLVSKAKAISDSTNGLFEVRGGLLYVDDQKVPVRLADKILKFSQEGLPFQPLVKFAKNILQNPSYRSVNQLFDFLESNNHPITDDGMFIAYKKVRDDFKDVHTGTMDNSVGTVVSMPRNQVDEDPERTCSSGLHVANFAYANDFYGGGLMLEVKVNPRDVVAVPVDYSNAKMRVCCYEVLGVVSEENQNTLFVSNPSSFTENDDYDDEEYDDYSSSHEYEDEDDYDDDNDDDNDPYSSV